MAFWFAQVLQIFHLNTRTNDKTPGMLALVRYFELTPFIDDVNRIVYYLSIQGATWDECDYTFAPNLQADENIDVVE